MSGRWEGGQVGGGREGKWEVGGRASGRWEGGQVGGGREGKWEVGGRESIGGCVGRGK